MPADAFSVWLLRILATLRTDAASDVPCGSCIGCCSSSYFIHLRPEDSAALRRIPKKLLFRAPGMPLGHVLMGFDEEGRCPMLHQGLCTIYEDRPTTCRTYDCRIFAAAGIAAGDDDKAVINSQVRRWSFDYPAALDRERHDAVVAATRFLQEHADSFPDRAVPTDPSQLAILALEVHGVFLGRPDRCRDGRSAAEKARIAKAVIAATRRFEARRDAGLAATAAPRGAPPPPIPRRLARTRPPTPRRTAS